MSAEVDAAIDALAAQVKANTHVEASAVVALNGFADRINAAVKAALAANPGISAAQLQGITDETAAMKASADAVSAAIVANTPLRNMHDDDGSAPYVAAVVVGTIIAAGMVLGILWLRPNADPLAVLGAVGGLAVVVTAQAITFIKSHETGKRVDGQLDAWELEYGWMQRAEGELKGTMDEQARVATLAKEK